MSHVETAPAALRTRNRRSLDSPPKLLVPDAMLCQDAGRHSSTLASQPEEQVFAPDVGTVQALRFLPR